MTATTYTKVASTLITSQSVAAGGVIRAAKDIKTSIGGLLTVKITNGPTPPTVQCQCNVYVAHNATTPAVSAGGVDWKLLATLCGGGSVANTVTEQSWEPPIGAMQFQVEFIGHTVQPVTVEAAYSDVTEANSV